ncbi:MAG: efflux transporter periplasmic adaptor subunit [Gammaproteobacteria bacterium]|jgi:RND family efflux transporter MFP subunit|nr:efflux transporter periplasmic adaptor subunit [Gammaproteobacteria bacterium]|tara:strand:+ start:4132 stop:5328 length:1197 start_codon:yes stop_codon:yes gene_type:complete
MINKLIIPFAIVFISSLVALWMFFQKSVPDASHPEPPVMFVDVIKAISGTVQIEVKAQGTVTPRTQTTLVSEVSGLVTEVSPAFVAGGFFSKGDILVRIDDRNYRADVKRAQASVAAAQTSVSREAGLADYALADWERAKSILQSSKAASDLALRKPQLAEAIANLEFARAELDKRQGDLDRTIIRAPYDGLVKEKLADIGQFVPAGTKLAVTFAIDIAEVRLPLPDRELPHLELSDKSLADGSGPAVVMKAEIGGVEKFWHGNIVRTEGVFDEQSRVLYVVVRVEDPYNRQRQNWSYPLRIGTFVEATIKGQHVENIIKLPRSVLRSDDEIWTVTSEKVLVPRKVELLRADEDLIYVSGGISENQLICMTMLDNPLPGTRVRYEVPQILSVSGNGVD